MRSLIAILFSLLLAAATSLAQSVPSVAADAPGPIQDNSFLVEEAYNQEDGVIQHISSFERLANSHDWAYSLTDEWPVRTLKHQLSITLLATHSGAYAGSGSGWGDTALNYRYQAIGSGETRVAFAPRFTAILPTGNSIVGRGLGGYALQTNLPLSVVLNDKFVTHWNAGATWAPRAKNDDGMRAGTIGVNLGQSIVWLAKPRFNVLVETVWNSSEDVVARGKTERSQDLLVSPGIRGAFNFKSGLQIVPGIAMPIGVGPSAGEKGVILYLSFEHPFAFAHSKK
jgi:Putative MetA-pathway of phenol degradation